MRQPHAAFAARLREALQRAGIEARPVTLEKMLARRGVVVTAQAISGWLSGRYMPRPRALQALADLTGMPPHQLQFGGIREESAVWPLPLQAADRRVIEDFLALPAERRVLVGELIAALAAPPRKTR